MTTKPSLTETHPDIAAQAFGWDPATVTFGSGKKMEWKCEAGHVWPALIFNRTKPNGTSCPYCAVADKRSLAETHPELAAQAHGWDPKMVTFGVTGKREWVCPLGHTFAALVHHRAVRGTGCPYCAGKKILKGFNDLATTHPAIANEAFGWDPTDVLPRADKRLEWQCGRGHRWSTHVRYRTARGDGCPGCYAMTFDEMTQRPLKFSDKQRKYT